METINLIFRNAVMIQLKIIVIVVGFVYLFLFFIIVIFFFFPMKNSGESVLGRFIDL